MRFNDDAALDTTNIDYLTDAIPAMPIRIIPVSEYLTERLTAMYAFLYDFAAMALTGAIILIALAIVATAIDRNTAIRNRAGR